jgi:hypothetical protein
LEKKLKENQAGKSSTSWSYVKNNLEKKMDAKTTNNKEVLSSK